MDEDTPADLLAQAEHYRTLARSVADGRAREALLKMAGEWEEQARFLLKQEMMLPPQT